jgi:hypothetical protein
MVKILRKWTDKNNQYQFGTDANGTLYCKDLRENVNMVLVDNCFKVKNKWYYKFINPNTNKIKLVER